MNVFFKWLEARVDSFPQITPQMPAKTTWGFIRFYARPFYPLLICGFMLSVVIAIIEVRVFSFLGLGAALIGLGYVYRRFGFDKK